MVVEGELSQGGFLGHCKSEAYGCLAVRFFTPIQPDYAVCSDIVMCRNVSESEQK